VSDHIKAWRAEKTLHALRCSVRTTACETSARLIASSPGSTPNGHRYRFSKFGRPFSYGGRSDDQGSCAEITPFMPSRQQRREQSVSSAIPILGLRRAATRRNDPCGQKSGSRLELRLDWRRALGLRTQFLVFFSNLAGAPDSEPPLTKRTMTSDRGLCTSAHAEAFFDGLSLSHRPRGRRRCQSRHQGVCRLVRLFRVRSVWSRQPGAA
jgi:hypothetical protein